ncbi:hypothetical protein AX14_011709, partial [Amanita brunnescens Koide BX004]
MSITSYISTTCFAFQNVHKSRLTVHELLENLKNEIDFLFIQENPISFIRNVPSSSSSLGDPLVGPVHHRQWQCIEKTAIQATSQVAIYVNTRFLDNFQIFPDFSLNLDPNVLPVTLRHNTIKSCSFTIVNVYNPPKTRNSAIRSLIDILPQLRDAIVIQGDFNLPSGIWDPTKNNSPPLSIDLFNHLSDEGFGLCNDEGAPTWTNRRGSFSVLDLVFIKDSISALEPDVFVNMEGRGRSDHALISLVFGSTEHWGRPYIPSGEEEEERFVLDLAKSIQRRANSDSNDVEALTAAIGQDILDSWNRNSKLPRIGSTSVTWWTAECQNAKDTFLACRTRSNQRLYDAATKKARTDFFNRKIDQMTANDSPWEGVRWTKPRPPPKYSTIRRNGQPIEDMDTLFETMHQHFSTSPAAKDISWEAINNIPEREVRSFPPISKKEIWDALRPTANSSAPGPDHVTWRHLKLALSIPETDDALMTLFNKVCFTGTWPSHFKDSVSVIIPKPSKPDYSILKAYRPIALLNTIGKLLTKILANRMQHDAAQYSLLHRDQFGASGTWLAHLGLVQFYTNKAFSTIRACTMLGNSVRGIGPRQRAHAYQACVLSVLTYGLALWYTTWGSGVIRLVKRMERVHSYAMGWIIGAFRTSPVGSRELIAGIPPLKILLNMRLNGTAARLLSLGEEHSLYRTWTLRWLPSAIARTTPRRRARHLPTDNPLTRLSATAVKEQFFPHHPIARPGERVADTFDHRLFFDLSAPKRSSKFFDSWVRDFKQKIEALIKDNRTLIFSDGAYWAKTSRASYAFTAFHASEWHDHYGWCPAGSSFDSEIAALEEAIQWAVVRRVPNPVFFIDNKSVLLSFLSLDTHTSQLSSIRINMLLKDYLSTTDYVVSFAHCPSHVGITGNDRADDLTKK